MNLRTMNHAALSLLACSGFAATQAIAGPISFVEEFSDISALDRFELELTNNVTSFEPVIFQGRLLIESSNFTVNGGNPWAIAKMTRDLGAVGDFELNTVIRFNQAGENQTQQQLFALRDEDGNTVASWSIADPWTRHCARVAGNVGQEYVYDTGLRNCTSGFADTYDLTIIRTDGVVQFYWGGSLLGEVENSTPVSYLEISTQRSPQFPAFGNFMIDRISFHGESEDQCAGDFNNDGQIDFFDVSAFLEAFGEGCP